VARPYAVRPSLTIPLPDTGLDISGLANAQHQPKPQFAVRELPHPFKLVTPGNHECILESGPFNRNLISNAIVSINEEIKILGLRICG
jgi:hypothetical protein